MLWNKLGNILSAISLEERLNFSSRGEFVNGKFHGQGALTWPEGHTYTGWSWSGINVLVYIKRICSSHMKGKGSVKGKAIQANFFTGLRKDVEPWLILTIAGFIKIIGKQLLWICFAFAIIVHTLCHLFQGICFQVFWDLAARSTCWSWSVHTFPWEMPSGVLPSTNQAHIFTLHLHCINPCSVSLHYLLFKDLGNIHLQVIMWIVKIIRISLRLLVFKSVFFDSQQHSHHCILT